MTSFYFIIFVVLSSFCSIRGDSSICFEGDFYCRTSNQCVPLRLRCNGVSDCHFGEDERGCSCAAFCDSDTRCVLRREQCNGIPDCLDKTDELNCSEINCAHDKFKCQKDGAIQCLDSSLRCDSQNDCDDASDETECIPSTASSAILAVPSKNQGGCDGEPFCPSKSSNSDQNCPFSSKFASTFRLFEIGAKISVRKCDTIPDCPLGEDEVGCPKIVPESVCSLENGLFLCANVRECLDFARVCDGFSQCSDGSDELALQCLRNFEDGQQEPDAYRGDDACPFRCKLPKLASSNLTEKAALMLPYSRFCILLEQVCDGEEDCPFGDDEDRLAHGCPASDETRYATQNCGSPLLQCDPVSTDCVVSRGLGPICVCKPGFRAISQSVTKCVDVDECSMGACEQFCENLPGSFECGCRDTFRLAPDNCQRCEALSTDEEPYFIFSTPNLIYRIDEASQMTRINLYHAEPGHARPAWSGAIPFDYARNDDLLIFYNWGSINAKLGHSNAEPWHFLSVDHDITYLSYDDLNANLYYNGRNKEGGYFWRVFYVGVFREKGQVTSASRATEFKTVVSDSTPGVTSSNLALYPEMGFMFFSTSYSGRDQLLFCALNGEGLKTTNWQFKRLRSLSVDRSAAYLYIFDAGRPGLGHVQILTQSSPASLGELIWIEERRSFFGPKPFISFSSGEYDSELYFLAGEITENEMFRTSFQAVNKSSLMIFEASVASPFSLITPRSLLVNTSFFRVRSVAPPLELDACFNERLHICESYHICLAKPPPPGVTSQFTRPICDCPDSVPNCKRMEPDLRPNFSPPGRPTASLDEFRERSECSNLVIGTKKRGKKKSESVLEGKTSDNMLNLGTWSANLTTGGGGFESDFSEESKTYDALKSTGKRSALEPAYFMAVLSSMFVLL